MADDPVRVGDVLLATANLKTAEGAESRRLHRVYRDRMIAQCYDGGDVTVAQLADVAQLSNGSIRRILRDAKPSPPKPKLRVVR